MLRTYPLLSRFLSKLLCEVLPATMASVLGALVLSHYVRTSPATPPVVVADPATAEMLQMARDEHARIVIYLDKNGEARTLADIAAEKELARVKAAERTALAAAQKARAAEQKTAALTTSIADKSAKKTVMRQPAQKPVKTALVQAPLQLSDAAKTPPQTTKDSKSAGHGEENLIIAKWRETAATVERIPHWVHGVVERIANNIPSLSLPDLRPPHLI